MRGKKLPEPGWTTEVEYVRAVDADTIEVEIRRRVNIRVRGVDAPERNTEAGKKATTFVDSLFKKAKKILLFIPSGNPLKLMDFNSFSRIVGDLWLDDKELRATIEENKAVKGSEEAFLKNFDDMAL
jgi:endonuclease YncB( thermonuclease family)